MKHNNGVHKNVIRCSFSSMLITSPAAIFVNRCSFLLYGVLKAFATTLTTPVSLCETEPDSFTGLQFRLIENISCLTLVRFPHGNPHCNNERLVFIGHQQKNSPIDRKLGVPIHSVLLVWAIWFVNNRSEGRQACMRTSGMKRNWVHVSTTPGRDRISPCALEERTAEGSTAPRAVCICIRNHSLSLTVTSVEHKCNRSDGATVIDWVCANLESNGHSFGKRWPALPWSRFNWIMIGWPGKMFSSLLQWLIPRVGRCWNAPSFTMDNLGAFDGWLPQVNLSIKASVSDLPSISRKVCVTNAVSRQKKLYRAA